MLNEKEAWRLLAGLWSKPVCRGEVFYVNVNPGVASSICQCLTLLVDAGRIGTDVQNSMMLKISAHPEYKLSGIWGYDKESAEMRSIFCKNHSRKKLSKKLPVNVKFNYDPGRKKVIDAEFFLKKFRVIPETNWCVNGRVDSHGAKDVMQHCQRKPLLGGVDSPDGPNIWTYEAKALRKVIESAFSGHRTGPFAIAAGEHFAFQQKTPKQRIMAALRDAKKRGY